MDNTTPQTAAREMTTDEILDDLFTYHAPDEAQKAKYEKINAGAKAFAKVILEECPSCPDRTSTIQDIRMARMRANSSIATKTGGIVPR